jgi:MFS family permease
MFFKAAARKGDRGLIDLQLFRGKTFAAAAVTQFVSNGISFAGQMLIPLYLILACGRSPSATGWLLAPLGLGMICSYPWMGALTQRFGIRKVSAGGVFLALVGTLPFQTLRFYEREGLRLPPVRTVSGYRSYVSRDLERMGREKKYQLVANLSLDKLVLEDFARGNF